MAYLDRNGVSIYYEIYGTDGPLIILSHGFAATSAMWSGQIDVLSKNHRLIIWDMRGHGKSDYPEQMIEYSEEKTVGDIDALIDVAGAETAIVGGLSLGGYMCLAYHCKHPDRVQALIIIDTGPGMKNDASREAWNVTANQMADDLENRGLEYLRELTPEMALADHRDTYGLVQSARGMLTQHDARIINSLPNIGAPTLLIVGEQDEPYLNAFGYMAKKIPHARAVTIAEAGHASNIDQPEKFNVAVSSFISEV